MSDADFESLRRWAESHAPAGCRQAKWVLYLLDRDALRRAELADADSAYAELRERLDRLNPAPFTHPCH